MSPTNLGGRLRTSSCIAHTRLRTMNPYMNPPFPFRWLRLPQLESTGFSESKLPSAAMLGTPNAYLVQETCLSSGGGRGEYKTTFSACLCQTYDAECKVTKTTPIVPCTAMRSFTVFLLIHFFLVLARAVPVSKTLSAKGSYPHPSIALFSRS
jgi:hypothetical protein